MKWLDRRIAWPAPYLALALTEADFIKCIRHLSPTAEARFPQSGAKTEILEKTGSSPTCIVAMSEAAASRSPIEVAGLLVHEAVHVWQAYCDDIGERCPGSEQEAYAIQAISQALWTEYVRQRKLP